jgi:hypothetical protein
MRRWSGIVHVAEFLRSWLSARVGAWHASQTPQLGKEFSTTTSRSEADGAYVEFGGSLQVCQADITQISRVCHCLCRADGAKSAPGHGRVTSFSAGQVEMDDLLQNWLRRGAQMRTNPSEPCYAQALYSRGCGTLFRLDSSGALTGVLPFSNAPPLGSRPYGEVVVNAAGKVSGTTAYSGDSGFGTVYQTEFGDGFKRYSFAGPPQDGAHPHVGLVEDGAGNLFGTTQGGTTVSNTGCFAGAYTITRHGYRRARCSTPLQQH